MIRTGFEGHACAAADEDLLPLRTDSRTQSSGKDVIAAVVDVRRAARGIVRRRGAQYVVARRTASAAVRNMRHDA